MVNKLFLILLTLLISLPSTLSAQNNTCLPPDCYLDGEEPIPPTDPKELESYKEPLEREEDDPIVEDLPTAEELLEDNPWPIELIESKSIKTNAEFQADIDKLVTENERLSNFERNQGMFSFEYLIDAKLFGFIDIKYPSEVKIKLDPKSQDRVKVKYPWYRFFLADDADDLETRIKGGLMPIDELLKTTNFTADLDVELVLSAQMLKTAVLVLGALD